MDRKNALAAIVLNMLAIIFPASIKSQVSNTLQTESPQDYFDRETQSEWLGQATAGIFAVTVSGDTVACSGSRKMLLPASTMKAITTGAALHRLGAGYRFETKIGYSGRISGGTLHGDLYIIGGGDPVLGSRNRIAEPVERTFGKWRAMLSEAGISRIEGRSSGDDRFFGRAAEADSWQWNDIGTYYGAGVSGLSFNENMQNINVTPGDTPGSPLKISIGYPQLPWMEYRFPCTTGEAGTGNTLYLFTSPFAPVGEMRGTLALDRKTKTEQVANKFPAYTCAWHFMKYLESCGITCSDGAADLGHVFGIPENETVSPDSLTVIGSTFSPSLAAIVSETNRESNNTYAETLMRVLGKECRGNDSPDSSAAALKEILAGLGTYTGKGLNIADGSGLSRQDSASPEFMCGFLKAMMDSPESGTYIESFPRPGEAGTLLYSMREYPSGIKARVRMKSGSMTGVRCYCGYVAPTAGGRGDIIIFSIMINNYFGQQSRLQRFLDRMIYLMATEN